MGIIWTIVIGFTAGVIAHLVTRARNEPSDLVLTSTLGIVGALLATYLGPALGWYSANESAGLIGSAMGAIIILLIWGAVSWRSAT